MVKDYLGAEVEIGDYVVLDEPYNRSTKFTVGRIKEILPGKSRSKAVIEYFRNQGTEWEAGYETNREYVFVKVPGSVYNDFIERHKDKIINRS